LKSAPLSCHFLEPIFFLVAFKKNFASMSLDLDLI
jgi:hypothetical protein